MTTAVDLIAIEDAWVVEPIVEQPRGSNHTRLGVEYGLDRQPWCAITQTLAIGDAFGHELYRSAAVSQWIEAARQGVSGMQLLPPDAWITAGMLVTYDFGPAHGKAKGNPANFHIAKVRDPGTQEKFQTNGGNEGDAMRQQWRDRRYVTHFIALPYSTAPAPPSQGDDDMGYAPGQCRDKTGRKWFFGVGDDLAIYSRRDDGQYDRLGGIWTSGVDATCESSDDKNVDGLIVVTGRAADGQLQQMSVYTKGGPKIPPGKNNVEFELLGGHLYPKA